MLHEMEQLRQRLPLPELMQQLGLGAHARKSAFCPFHENTHTPAFSVYADPRNRSRWKCHAGCGGGDELEFLMRWEKCSRAEALVFYRRLAGFQPPVSATRFASFAPKHLSAPPPGLQLPDDLHPGTRAELETVSRLRKVDFWSVATLQHNQVLRFGTVCGEACWMVTDASGRTAEARCLSGRPFPAFRDLGERKAHTLRGSSKGWPVGLHLPQGLHESFERVLLCEGSGDLLAAYHFALKEGGGGLTWQPVAMLGASAQLHPDALALLRKKRVKIIPHADKAGLDGAQHWARALSDAGCAVSLFDLEGLRKKDGSRVKDLNDCTDLHDADRDGLEGLWV
jgi:hypothetical protein